jgi:hypothetical protein
MSLYLGKAPKRPCSHPHISIIVNMNMNMKRKKYKKCHNPPDLKLKKGKKNNPELLNLCLIS